PWSRTSRPGSSRRISGGGNTIRRGGRKPVRPSGKLQPDREMVRAESLVIHACGHEARYQLRVYESMIEMHCLRPLARRLRPGIAAGSYRSEPRQRIHRPVCAQGPLTVAVAMPHHVQIFRRFRGHVEITEHDEIPGKRRIGKAETSTAGQHPAFRLEIHRTILEKDRKSTRLNSSHVK